MLRLRESARLATTGEIVPRAMAGNRKIAETIHSTQIGQDNDTGRTTPTIQPSSTRASPLGAAARGNRIANNFR